MAALADAAPTQAYSHGDPTAEEQYLVEILNRARANPPQEGIFLTTQTDSQIQGAYGYAPFGVNFAAIRAAFNSYPSRPPLAFSPYLVGTARNHAQWMAANGIQDHDQPGNTFSNRIISSGYGATAAGENIYGPVPSMLYAHVGLNIDWGVPSLVHRNAIMGLAPDPVYKEVGVGFVASSRQTWSVRVGGGVPTITVNYSPYAVVQDFGISYDFQNAPIVTGVAFTDRDGDIFYTPGEGEGGITVTPDVGTYYAVTSSSGGYAIPLVNLPAGTTTVTLSFTGGALGSRVVTRTVTLNGSDNIKADLQVLPDAATRLTNLSTRLRVETGDNVAIAGFVVSGSASKRVLVRALGPSLAAGGVANVLANPALELRSADGTLLSANDNWQGSQSAEITATGRAPGDARESALIATLAPGAYTAIMRGADGGVGVGLIEVYDLDAAVVTTKAVNVSTRGRVATGDDVMIGGFVIGGSSTRRMVVRALGPSLAAAGVAGTLSDPSVEIRDARGTLITSNDNWQSGGQVTTLQSLGKAPSDPREAALVVTLNPGAYTAIVRGANGTTGVALVEVYEAP